MNKLRLTIITLLVVFASQAKAITTADVVGTWTINKVSLNGCGIDFETDGVFLSDEVKAQMDAEESGAYIDKLYEGLNRLHDVKLIFNAEGTVVMFMEGNTVEGTYAILNKNGVYSISIDNDDKTATINGGTLQWREGAEGDEFIMDFKKQ